MGRDAALHAALFYVVVQTLESAPVDLKRIDKGELTRTNKRDRIAPGTRSAIADCRERRHVRQQQVGDLVGLVGLRHTEHSDVV